MEMQVAIKPKQEDAFVREVDEELRRERLSTLFARYGWWIIAAVVLFLAAIGGWIWWQNEKAERAAAQAQALIEAMEAIQAGNREAALPLIEELAQSDIEGYRAAALFARANAQIAAGETDAAAATLGEIAAEEGLDEPYRNAALVRQTALQFDALPPAQVIQRLRPLAEPESPWFGSAGEMVAIAYLQLNQPERAGPIFAAIAQDEEVPASIRTRAVQMAGSLGINALEDAAEAAAPAAPDGAATNEAAAAEEATE